jgi:hypothetical protein
MSYENIKEEIKLKTREKITHSRKIQSCKDDLAVIDSSINQVKQQLALDIEENEQLEKERYLRESTISAQARRDKVAHDLQELEEQYRRAKDSLDENNIYDSLASENKTLLEIKESSLEVKEMISRDIGSRFADVYVKQLNSSTIILSDSDIQTLLSNFNSLKERIEQVQRKERLSLIEKLEDAIRSFSSEKIKGDAKGALILTAVLSVLVIATAWITFPIYLSFLFYTAFRNVKLGALYSRTLIEYKAVSDNLELYETQMRELAKEEFSAKLQAMELNFADSKEAALQELLLAEDEISSARTQAIVSFKFDASTLEKTAQTTIAEMESRRTVLEETIRKSLSAMELIKDELAELERSLSAEVEDIKSRFFDLTKMEKQAILDRIFLLDIKDDKPVMFEYPEEQSCIFLYNEDEAETVYDFIKLLLVQLRVRMNPHSLRLRLWDKEKMGVNFTRFVINEPDLFKIIASQQDITATLEEMNDLIIKRNEIVIKEYKNLTAYNEVMLSLDSLPESYFFTFVLDLSDSLLNDELFNQMISVGPAIGLFTNLFLPMERLNKSHITLFEKNVMIYTISNGKVSTKARDWAIEELNKFKN